MTKRIMKGIIGALFALIAAILAYNYFADRLLETMHRSSKPHDASGIVLGEGPVEIKRDADTALIIIHGYTSSPSRFYHLINFLEVNALDVDIYAPLLPFHGRGLEDFKTLSHSVIKKFVKDFLDQKQLQYKKLVVIGESYGALVLADILQEPNQYPTSEFIFSSPGFFLNCNTPETRLQMLIASKFMDYCPNCYGPYTTDDFSKLHARFAQKHGVVCFKSFIELLALDQLSAANLMNIKHPYTIVASEDDDFVDIAKLKSICAANPDCTAFLFPDGGHFVHWGKYAKDYRNYILKELRNTRPQGEFLR